MNIIGINDGMVFWPYPDKVIAPDGAAFQAVILYNTADKNIGILRTLPDGQQEVFSEELFAASDTAEAHAADMCAAYMRKKKLRNRNFPLWVRDIAIAVTGARLELQRQEAKPMEERTITAPATLVECAADTDRCAKVRIGCLNKDAEHGDWSFAVSLEDTVREDVYRDEFTTLNLSGDELLELLGMIQSKVIEAAKAA